MGMLFTYRVSGTFEASVEVPADEVDDFDFTEALVEAIGSYNATYSDADFEVTDSPTGFDTVVEALGYDREQAIAVYAALASAGLDVF